ncbi:MAG TPA: hypothetical protein VF897_25175 [Roseiflexaceae bacterium]
MNANRLAPIPSSTWFWRGIAALEALVLATVVAIGLAGRLPIAIAPSPVVAPAARVSAPATVQKGVFACKPCREEVLAASQAQLSAPVAFAAREPVVALDPATQSVLNYLRAHGAIQPNRAAVVQKGLIACKPCREEVLAAAQARPAPSALTEYESRATFEGQQVDRRGAGPR